MQPEFTIPFAVPENMSDNSDTIECTKRKEVGTTATKRLRAAGSVPASLYGHGEDTISIALPAGKVDPLLEQGVQVIQLSGESDESALIKDVQWDALGIEILHLDLLRVKKGEKVEVSVAVELVGDAPGAKEGGIVNHNLHAINIECFVLRIPESFTVNISNLQIGESIGLDVIEVEEGMTILDPEDSIIVACEYPVEEPAEGEEAEQATSLEPEVIGKADDDEEKGEGE